MSNTSANYVTAIAPTGLELSTGPYVIAPAYSDDTWFGVAIDGSGNIWITNSNINPFYPLPNGTVIKLTRQSDGTFTLSTFPGGGTNSRPQSLAIDHSGNVWVEDFNNIGLEEYTNAGTLLSPQGGYSNDQGGGAESVAIDGLSRAISANTNKGSSNPTIQAAGSLSLYGPGGTLLSQGSSSGGYYANYVIPQYPGTLHGVATDSSGNVWIAGQPSPGAPGGPQGSVVEIIGVAAPVLTPLSVANNPNMLGERP